jgi:putative transposase
MIDRRNILPLTRPANLLLLGRSSIYAVPWALPSARPGTVRRLDALHLEHPLAGSWMLRDMLRLEGITIGRLPRGFVYLATVVD